MRRHEVMVPGTAVTMPEPDADLRIERIDAWRWRLPRQGSMLVDGLIFASDQLIRHVDQDSLRQVANVASLPGIVGHSIGMPDIHPGYGFPIGGVAAFDPDAGGVISPGGVGYDINCGVRLLRSDLTIDAVRPHLDAIMNQIMRDIPAGVGAHDRGPNVLDRESLVAVLREGSRWLVGRGWATAADLEHTEAGGCFEGADPDRVSEQAMRRGLDQLGTLGSGNHFIEVGEVAEIHDPAVAAQFGLRSGTITVLIHSGSRGLGHQTCEDHLATMVDVAARTGIDLPDRQLACGPLGAPESLAYMAAMEAAANYAFANRQMMTYRVRAAFERVLGTAWPELGQTLVYDVAHNMAKWEEHELDGRTRRLCVHRKGATRAFPPGHPDVPPAFRDVGQPVLIPGDMARASFVLVGTSGAFAETFGSCCHGAGRQMSRHEAKRSVRTRNLRQEFRERGIVLRAPSYATVAEEIPEAYKDISEVVDAVHGAGIGRKVARLKPLGVLKG